MLEEDEDSEARLVIMTIKYQNQTFQVDMESGTLVSDLKLKLHDLIELSFDRQRLIYNGRILKDSEMVDDLEDATVRVVKLAENQLVELDAGFSSSSSSSKAVGSGNGNLEDAQLKYLKRIMDNPIMKQLTSNQDFLKSMFSNNPQMKKLFEDNPELEHIMNDPSMMKDAVEMMRNPSYQREMMRNQDRALSNIEMLPEGFNALRRTYSTIQKPMFDALDESTKATMKEEKGNGMMDASPNKLNKNPLPNPWTSSRRSSHSASASTPASTSLPSSLPSSWLPFPMPSSESNTSSFQERSLLNAIMQQRRESRQSQGGSSNSSSHPLHLTFREPTALHRRPSLSELQRTFANANLSTTASNTSSPFLTESDSSPGSGSGSDSNVTRIHRKGIEDEEATSSRQSPTSSSYETELQTLYQMGFTNRQENLEALSESNGNVGLAIEKLLRQMK